ncbi:MAG: creatininase family protein [Spirochaetota bacterium]
MNWERLTSPEFAAAVETTERVCLLPLGVIEKHGDHLPLGQDTIYIHEVCARAAEREPAMVFPAYYFGQIHEARHVPGTIAIDGELLVRLLFNVCEEISRNGFRKIVLVNGHGGNSHLISYFLQLTLEEEHAWTAYASMIPGPGTRSAPLLEASNDGHAGEKETSAMLHLHPELVRLDAYRDYGQTLGRTSHLRDAGVATGIWWYADHPGHLQAEQVPFTAKKGEAIVDDHIDHLVHQIQVVKADTVAPELLRDYYARNDAPSNRYP